VSRKKKISLLGACLIAIAAPALAQSLPTPQNWPKNQIPSKPPDAIRMCVFNAGPDLQHFPFNTVIGNQELDIQKMHAGWKSKAASFNPTRILDGRTSISMWGESGFLVELGLGDYYCRSFSVGASVGISVQYASQLRAGSWEMLCDGTVPPFPFDITLVLGAQKNPIELDSCKYFQGSQIVDLH